jgi:hypothetical protein
MIRLVDFLSVNFLLDKKTQILENREIPDLFQQLIELFQLCIYICSDFLYPLSVLEFLLLYWLRLHVFFFLVEESLLLKNVFIFETSLGLIFFAIDMIIIILFWLYLIDYLLEELLFHPYFDQHFVKTINEFDNDILLFQYFDHLFIVKLDLLIVLFVQILNEQHEMVFFRFDALRIAAYRMVK